MKKKIWALLILSIWTFVILIVMLMRQYINLEIFFILWLIGLLITMELIKTRNIQNLYLKKIKVIAIVGIIIFSLIFLKKLLVLIN